MRIVHFYSENFKRIKVVDFSPDQNMVLISGKNGQGKSSILDAIWAIFQHKANKSNLPMPVREGEDQAKTIIEIDGYVISRTFDTDGETRLRIETTDGKIVKSPQAMLDGLVSTLSFDPLKFAEAKDADRKNMIQDIFKINFAEFEAREAEAKDARKEKKRELAMIDGRMKSILPPTHSDPVREVSVEDLIAKLNSAINRRDQLNTIEARLVAIDKQIESLQKERQDLATKKAEIAALGEENFDQIESAIRDNEKRNARAREVIEYMRLSERLSAVQLEIKKLDDQIELTQIERDEAIEAANIPVSGLEIREDGTFMNNIPFNQLSQAEKIRASMAIAMAANPDLRVMRIVDGSLLDQDSMKLVETLAKDNDYQIWVEVVSNDDKIGVVIEDGQVKAIN